MAVAEVVLSESRNIISAGRESFSPARTLTAYWALADSARYRHAVTLWFGVFCAGFCVLPGELAQRALFYAFVPVTLPAVVDVFRRVRVAPATWVLAAFLGYSAISALWSGQWLTVGDAARKAVWIFYLLVLCCAVGAPGPAVWRAIFRRVQVFSALFALLSMAEFYRICSECGRLTGFGAHANSNYTASVAATLGLLGLAAVLNEPGRIRPRSLFWQAPTLLLLLATGSRAALLAYVGGVLLSLALLAARGGVRHAALALGAAVACLVAAGGAAFWLGGAWLRAELGRGDTFRLQIWSANIDRFLERPWFGHGSTAVDRFAIGDVVVGEHAHNLFLAQAFYGGVPGVLLWLAVFALAIRVAARVWRDTGDSLPAVALFFLLAAGLVDFGFVLVDVQAIWLYVWVVLGIVLSYDVAGRRSTAS